MAGLFGMAGGGQEQPQEQARPRRGLLGLDRDRSDMIAMALSGMTMNPNEGLMRALAGRMENRREDARLAEARQLEEAQAEEATNRTRRFIEAQVRAGNLSPQYLEMAQVDPAGAYSAAVKAITAQPEDNRTALIQNFQYARDELGMDDQAATAFARGGGTTVNVNNADQATPPDAILREELQKDQAASLTAIVNAGTKAASARSDIEALRALSEVAPSGPLQGRIAEMFPAYNDAAAVRQAILKRVAPTLRVEGSGSTSDIEYAGMIEGMGRLTNSPETNMAIADMMLAKSDLDLERAALVSAYQRGEVPYNDMLTRLDELNRRSIMPPSLRNLLDGQADQAKPSSSAPSQPRRVIRFDENGDRIND